MAYGLQIFDTSGNIVLDSSTRHMTLYGIYYFTVPANVPVVGGDTSPVTININVPGINPSEFYAFTLASRSKVTVTTDTVSILTYPYYKTSNSGDPTYYLSLIHI